MDSVGVATESWGTKPVVMIEDWSRGIYDASTGPKID